MFGIIKKMFIVSSTNIVNASNHTKCTSLINQKCNIQPTLINLHLNKWSQELRYYPFAVKLDKCVGSYDTLNDLSNRVCVPNKTEGLNTQQVTIDISCRRKCHFDGRKCNSNQKWNNDKCQCECKNLTYVKKIMFGILLDVVVKMENI